MPWQDFSSVMREYRLFYVKLPNGLLQTEVYSINKPLAQLRDKLCEALEVGEYQCCRKDFIYPNKWSPNCRNTCSK